LLQCKSGETDHSRRAASPGLQKARCRADEVPKPRQRCLCPPEFKRIKLNPAHTSYPLSLVRTAPHRMFLILKSSTIMKIVGVIVTLSFQNWVEILVLLEAGKYYIK
jgi:hypothetical protein